MANIRLATRYAEALMMSAEEQKVLDRVAAEMEMLDRMLQNSREFLLFLKSPVISREKKQAVLGEIFAKQLHALTMGFLRLLAEKGREEILHDICTRFFALRDERLGIVSVNVRSATELSKDQQKNIQKRFEGLIKKSVRLAVNVEKDLKGGFLARVGDTVYDGSVKRQLEMLRKRFAEGVGVN